MPDEMLLSSTYTAPYKGNHTFINNPPDDGESQLLIEHSFHEALFIEVEKFAVSGSLIFRMEDHFSEISYTKREIPLLKKEYDLLLSKSENIKLIRLMKAISKVCEKAIKEDKVIFTSCD